MDKIQAAVALITVGADPHILLVRRADNPLDPWSGHWALPGGRREVGETPLMTCLRECEEECGVALDGNHLAEELPIALAGTAMGHSITVAPFHWHLDHRPEITIDTSEIQSVSYLPISAFSEWASHASARLSTTFPERDYPFYEHQGIPLWGFTYQVLRQWVVRKLS